MKTGFPHLTFKTDYRENRWQASVINENTNQGVFVGRYSTHEKMIKLAPRRLKHMMKHSESHVKRALKS